MPTPKTPQDTSLSEKKLRCSAVCLIYHHLCKKKKEGISLHVYTTLCIVYKFYVLKNSYYTVLRYVN